MPIHAIGHGASRRMALSRNRLIETAIASVLLSGAPLAVAQDTSSRGESSSATGLEEVVVTAQRREENLQRSAVAITALTGESIVNMGVTAAEDLSRAVPAIQIQQTGGPFTSFYLRGIGDVPGNTFHDNSIAFNFDGVYVSRPVGPNGMFYDLERVEVLKGPQGTLYGRNASGGAVNVIPVRPELGEFGGAANVDLGNFNLVKVDAALNLPIGMNAALRIAGQSVDRDGYFDDGTGDADGKAGRVQFRVAPSDSLSILLSGDYYKQGGKGEGASVLPVSSDDAFDGLHSSRAVAAYNALGLPEVGHHVHLEGFRPDPFPSLAGEPAPDVVTSAAWDDAVLGEHQDNTFWGTHATIDWTTDLGTLTFVPAYRKTKQDFTATSTGFVIDVEEDDEQTSAELRFASSEDQPFQYVVGAYYFKESISTDQYYDQSINTSEQIVDLDTDTSAVFGQGTLALTDALRLTAGVRYTKENKELSGVNYSILLPGTDRNHNGIPDCVNVCFYGFPGAADPYTGDKEWSRVNWKAGIELDVAPAWLVYGDVRTGFKAGGFFAAPAPNTYEPEKLTAYTIGSKSRFLDNRLQLNAELFYWKFEDQQVSHLSVNQNGVYFPTENVGSSTIKGVEVETQFLLTDTMLLSANVQYLDATYDDFTYNQVNLTSAEDLALRHGCPASLLAPLPITPGSAMYELNCSGFQMPLAPEWTAHLGIEQRFDVAADEIILSLTGRYQAEQYSAIDFSFRNDSYTTVDASLMYSGGDGTWRAGIWGNNLTDEVIPTIVGFHPLVPVQIAPLRAPRTYGVRVQVQF